MTANGKKVFIVYFSAAGSTRHVAEVMEKRFGTGDVKTGLILER